ncbi:YjgN family protein [Rhizobium sp. LEGMi198b]
MAVVEKSYPIGESRVFQRASFTGRAAEYFGIWIVNVLLTIITLGIYSAWAKVRRNRYFYGNTALLGHTFEYHAKGKQIFIGRLIVFGLLVALNILSHVAPLAVLAIWPVMLVVFPWFLMRGLKFNARVTSYRNVRFDFVGTYGGALKAIFLGALVTIISLGLLSPVASRWFYKYIFDNLRYGDRQFSTEPRLGALYEAFVTVVAIVIAGIVILGLFSAVASGFGGNSMGRGMGSISLWHWMIVLIIPIYIIAGLYYRAAVRNIIWSAAMVDHRHQLKSDLGRRRYAWIAISNVIVTFATLGLMRPWAAVRLQRYLAEHTAIHVDGEIGVVFDQIRSTGGVISAEYLDVDGFDFGF